MKIISGLIAAVTLLPAICFSQDDKEHIQTPTFGVHFFFDDFNSAAAVRASSLSAAIRNRQFGKVKDMSPGLALNYIQGLSPTFDFSAMLAGSFLDYPKKDGGTLGDNALLMELDASVRGKMFSNKYWVSPYVQLGVGISKFKGYWGAFIPAGVGMQLNLFDEAFLLVNSQYRIPVTENTSNYHFFHSIGLAGIIGKKATPRAPVPVPLPVAPPPPADRDGDGIVDSADVCPDVPGIAMFKGCADQDNDSIPDNEDKCPQQRGVARYQGCPVPDTDGDGINDEDDKCKTVAGVVRYQGCPVPDRDNDGVNDEEDKCPDLAGTIANNGCPEIKEEVRKRIEVAAKNIFFATGSYRLLKTSNTALNEVAKLMQEDANLKLDIEGHTDNTGKPEKNQVLSEQRALAVYEYLAKKGVPAERLQSAGFGQDKPIAQNTTSSGRSKNRRVELRLHYD